MKSYQAPEATAAARVASEQAHILIALVNQFAGILADMAAERTAAEAVLAEGYRLDLMHEALELTETSLGSAADALQSQQYDTARDQLGMAQAKLVQAVASGSGAPALRAANVARLTAIQARGEAAARKIAEGHEAFDQVDEFAESSWSDIQGNGSEAEAAADRAHEHWERAQQQNSMEVQAFVAAGEQLDAADQELTYVDQLIEAITTRLQDLETARASARELLEEAERSIEAGLAFVKANDPDVSKAPEQQLHEASQQLAVAQQEAAQAKPDWLRLATAATTADRLADAALAAARGEAESMEKLRQQVEKLGPLVSGEINKIARFINLHGNDIQATTTASVKALVQRFEEAQQAHKQAGTWEEDRRRTAFKEALEAYSHVQTESSVVYQAALADTQRLEQLRTDLNNALTEARTALEEAERLAQQAGKRTPSGAQKQVTQARARFDKIRLPITGEQELKQTIEEAKAIAKEAREAANEIRSHTSRPSGGGGGLGPVIIMGAGRRGGWGGSGSWSSGSSRGSSGWGSGGRSGGSFGGGRSGGSFGGGRSGGGW